MRLCLTEPGEGLSATSRTDGVGVHQQRAQALGASVPAYAARGEETRPVPDVHYFVFAAALHEPRSGRLPPHRLADLPPGQQGQGPPKPPACLKTAGAFRLKTLTAPHARR